MRRSVLPEGAILDGADFWEGAVGAATPPSLFDLGGAILIPSSPKHPLNSKIASSMAMIFRIFVPP
jgi:hypothetical protein